MVERHTSTTTDVQLDAVAVKQRRRLLFALLECDEGSEQFALVPDGGRFDPDEEFRLSMKHVHLPKLADLGYVDWDRESDTVTRGPQFDAVEPLLEVLYAHERGQPLCNA